MSNSDPPPLTDTFTVPSTCYQSTFGAQITTETANGIYFLLGDPNSAGDCLPSAVGTSTVSYFSPGLYCPHDWTTACSRTSDGQAIATCCPPGSYVCELQSTFADLYYWITLYPCISYVGDAAVTATSVPVIITSPTSHTIYYTLAPNDAVNAPGVELRVDISANTASVTTSSMTTSSGITAGSVIATNSVITTTSVASKHKDSTKALAIGLGVPLGIIGAAVLGAAVWFFQRRKKGDKSQNVVDTGTTGETRMAEADSKALKPTVEIDGITAGTRVHEVDNSQARAELPV
ncbi:hypothetical protein BKA56DRAFT_580911 [Ilyonectria sp. MPI-CAGE-AT-0026]|nr:hypothetical protein BKA56DRAFT_580911 [Ilyonectria sp. MPI-CAGE-AT-0026]